MRLLAAALLLICSPLILVLMLAVRLTSRGPAIFRQERVGKDGIPFTLLKLRTMTVETAASRDADPAAAGPADSGSGTHTTTPTGPASGWATAQQNRITPLGGWLRRHHLDELPELVNVVRGELALVGPRPEQLPIARWLERELPRYAERHSVLPGMTGWAQVNYGYPATLEQTRTKLELDLYYIEHCSLWLDLRIGLMTARQMFTGAPEIT